ncbi:tryptophan-rich sensory protein [Sporosarcina sp. UB5]|uniref:tryptophan-rich sensory protein n=1 Tax=Sporosarcina sp. UB5 TaxID=3047463 RepID=UPI003D79365E
MIRILLMSLSLCTVILINITASFYSLNGNTTGEITNRLPLLFVPADYVMIICWLLYILLFFWIFNFNNAYREMSLANRNLITIFFIISCLLHISWTFLWHYDLFTITVITKIVLLIILLTFYFSFPKHANELIGRVPFSLLTGWIIISTISNASYYLMLLGWTGFGLSDPLWAVFYLTASTAFALHFMYHYNDFVLNLVFVWAFIGIAVRNGTEELFISVAAIFYLPSFLRASSCFQKGILT